jgi:membrane protein DedA with SNARE-associated domain
LDLQEIIEQARVLTPWGLYALLFFAAFIEYVIPPLPGDTTVVAGVTLASAWGWDPVPFVFVVSLGAALGASTAFGIGRWLSTRQALHTLGPRKRMVVNDLIEKMRRRGAVYLIFNRFLPGVRAIFFLAAGVAGLRFRAVLFYATASALVWNSLLVWIGYSLGNNVDTLDHVIRHYSVVIGSVVATIVILWLLRLVIKTRGEVREGNRAEEVHRDTESEDQLHSTGNGASTDRE